MGWFQNELSISMNCVNGPCAAFVASGMYRVRDKCFNRERDCELREFRVRESRKCEFRDRESRNCVTVNLVSAASVIANAVSLTFERMTLLLNEIVNIPSSVCCQISHSASWKERV